MSVDTESVRKKTFFSRLLAKIPPSAKINFLAKFAFYSKSSIIQCRLKSVRIRNRMHERSEIGFCHSFL